MTDELMKARERLIKTVKKNLSKAEKDLKDARLEHDVLAAILPVYEQHGERHDSTYGIGQSLSDLAGSITTLETELSERQAELTFLQYAQLPGLNPNDEMVTEVINIRADLKGFQTMTANPTVLPAGTKMVQMSSGYYRPAEPGEEHHAELVVDVDLEECDRRNLYHTNAKLPNGSQRCILLSKRHLPKGQGGAVPS